ncbi:type II secretion system protein [Desulfobacula phenolica]|uniref:Prepilin-type N-terminal cleavage/methylation domain-containing protein n=1 Tax=Desulfobacula phenolica TaxID=90732 RepID=A0A1H2J134_9BACT|nr:type II secretion system protein [Desulfobacula phenolica]SDU49788.1 prepilin-type N-terminal cleavage/methylation domain-containing protein [Desulfobacula phenolica]
MHRLGNKGFTFLELILVVAIIGGMMLLILPRTQRTFNAAKISLVRQAATEIGSYTIEYAQNMSSGKADASSYTPASYLLYPTLYDQTGPASASLVNHYTGNPVFQGVKQNISLSSTLSNPFNKTSYFDEENDDSKIPSEKPGLLYLVSSADLFRQNLNRQNISQQQNKTVQDPSSDQNSSPAAAKAPLSAFIEFYFIYTGTENAWHGQMGTDSLNGIRNGMFVARLPAPRHE